MRTKHIRSWWNSARRSSEVRNRWWSLLGIPAVATLASHAAAAPPPISPELSSGPVISEPPNVQRRVRAASDGAGYFVVWEDFEHKVVAARVSASGIVLDPVGLPVNVTPAEYMGSYPTVAFDGTNYLVLWNGDTQLKARRIGKNGAPVDKDELDIASGSRNVRSEVAFGGGAYLAVWQTAGGIFGRRISAAGALLDAGPVLLATAPTNGNIPRGVASDGTHWLVAWQEAAAPRALRAMRFSSTLAPLDATPITIATDVTDAAPNGSNVAETTRMIFDGTSFVIPYTTATAGRLAKISTAGVVTILPTGLSTTAGIAWDGSTYRVLTGHYVTGVAPDGTVVAQPTQSPARPTSWPAGLACGSAGCLFAWSGTSDGTVVAASRLVANAWQEPNGFRLVSKADDQREAWTASHGNQGLLVWWQEQGTPPNVGATGAIFGARVTSAGGMTDPAGIRVSPIITPRSSVTGDLEPGGYYTPRAATNGTDYLVVWPQPNIVQPRRQDLMGARFSAAGVVLDPVPFTIWTAADLLHPPQVRFDGTNYLVIGAGTFGVTRVSPSGAVLDPVPVPTVAPLTALAWNGIHYLAVYSTGGTDANAYDIKGIRLDSAFQPVDPLPFTICGAPGYQDGPNVASDGKDFIVAWSDGRNNGNGGIGTSDIYGSRVDASGQVLEPNGVPIEVNTIGKQRQNGGVAIAYSPGAQRYFAVWSASTGLGDGRGELRGAEIERSGIVRAPGSYVVSPAPYVQARPSLSVMDGSKLLVGYSRFDPSAPYGSRRVRARVVDLDGTSDAGAGDGGADGGTGDASDAGGNDGGVTEGGSSGEVPPADAGNDGGSGGSDGERDHHCGCRVVGIAQSTSGSLDVLVAGVILLLRRRRRT